jgi:hypothetical protein
VAASYDHIVSALAAASLKPKRLLTPWGTRRFGHTVTTTVTTTVRVIDCVHDHTAHAWALAQVAIATSLTDLHILVLFVADNTDRSRASQEEPADFAARHTHLGVLTLFGHQHSAIASAADSLSTTAWLQLQGMDGGTNGDVGEWQAVAHFYRGLIMSTQFLALLHTTSCQNVVVDTLIVFDSGYSGTTVGVVLNVFDYAFTRKIEVD